MASSAGWPPSSIVMRAPLASRKARRPRAGPSPASAGWAGLVLILFGIVSALGQLVPLWLGSCLAAGWRSSERPGETAGDVHLSVQRRRPLKCCDGDTRSSARRNHFVAGRRPPSAGPYGPTSPGRCLPRRGGTVRMATMPRCVDPIGVVPLAFTVIPCQQVSNALEVLHSQSGSIGVSAGPLYARGTLVPRTWVRGTRHNGEGKSWTSRRNERGASSCVTPRWGRRSSAPLPMASLWRGRRRRTLRAGRAAHGSGCSTRTPSRRWPTSLSKSCPPTRSRAGCRRAWRASSRSWPWAMRPLAGS